MKETPGVLEVGCTCRTLSVYFPASRFIPDPLHPR
jgi:hypothetical protein